MPGNFVIEDSIACSNELGASWSDCGGDEKLLATMLGRAWRTAPEQRRAVIGPDRQGLG